MTTSENERPSPPTVAEVVGLNAQRLRGTNTAEQFAVKARAVGLKWDSGRVSELERGKVSPTLPTLICLTEALAQLLDRPIALAELLRYDGPVQLNRDMTVPGTRLVRYVSPEPVIPSPAEVADLAGEILERAVKDGFAENARVPAGMPKKAKAAIEMEFIPRLTEADQRAAKKLGITVRDLTAWSVNLWFATFAEERDSRTEPAANAQVKGQIARKMLAEVRSAMETGVPWAPPKRRRG